MINAIIIDNFAKFVGKENIYQNEEMSRHTTFRIGGEAELLLEIQNKESLKKSVKYVRALEKEFFVLGNGSNLLVSDKGYPGVVLHIGKGLSDIRVEGNKIIAQSGALLSKVASVARDYGLTGLEFASGIPGSIGGAMVMNAGAYDGEMSQVVETVEALDTTGEYLELENRTMEFGYRTSILKKVPLIVTEVTFTLQIGDKNKIQEKMDDFAARRKAKQPLEFASAGSTFKRPEGNFAGKLIMEAGLSGFTVGDAQVSEKHCGFVINRGKASATDVEAVIEEVQRRVKENANVTLEPEVIRLGSFK